RGMAAITRAGGAQARIWGDRNRIAPIFELEDVAQARAFAVEVESHFEQIRVIADSTTRFGRLESVHAVPVGRRVILELGFFTADAHGMNMLSRAAGAVCGWIRDHLAPASSKHLVLSGFSAEKRPAGSLLRGGKGKKVTAGCRLPASVVRSILRTSPAEIVDLWRSTVLAHLATGAYGYNGHAANGLTALMIATGQDVANIANAAVCITSFEMRGDDLEASVTLPSLVLATVGGGTGLDTSGECLEMLGCKGTGGARRLSEIAAATVLAGELSMGAALASGEFVAAHEAYGRNRPGGAGEPESGG
ncbi:MAG: 3-hydroxy-3-methylglutaryl-CoA reductase, partial [Acidobacteriota bacterium]